MTTQMTSLRHSATPGNWRTEFERIYAAPQYRRACQARRNPKRASWLVELIARAFDTVQEWQERARSRRLLGGELINGSSQIMHVFLFPKRKAAVVGDQCHIAEGWKADTAVKWKKAATPGEWGG